MDAARTRPSSPDAPLKDIISVQRSGKFRRWVQARLPQFPEFNHIGFDVFSKVGNLGRHDHPGLFEICLIIRGHVTWWARDNMYDLRGGDVYFTWPDEPHGGLHELMHPCTIYWTTVSIPKPDDPAAKSFLCLPEAEALELCARVHALPERHLRGAEKLQSFYEAMFEHLGARTVLGVIQARAALQCLLSTLVSLPLAGSKDGFVPPGITRTREFLDGCPRPWPNVAELANVAGMSVSHFHACFVKEVGMAPMEYAHRARLNRAQKLLSSGGASVTDVAGRMGYCSSQHLAACFKRYLGMTPTKARKTTAV